MDNNELFDLVPDLFFGSLREQMILGMLPSETVETLLQPLLDDYNKTISQLPVRVQNEINIILFKIYPEISGEYGINQNDTAKKPEGKSVFSIKKIIQGIERLMDVWTPYLAGQTQLATAADIPEQKHTFDLKDGKAEIKCHWKQSRGTKPAFIHISWTASISTDQEMRLLFINPETDPPEIRYEVSLRTIRIGETTFTADELGFDPATERWGIAVTDI